MSMKITVRPNTTGRGPAAFASVFINDIFHVDGIKIWDNQGDGINVQMPGYSKQTEKRKYYNSYFRYDSQQTQKTFNEEIEAAYAKTLQTA